MSRNEVLEALRNEPYAPEMLEADKDYVIKKLGLTSEEFEAIMNQEIRRHEDFATDKQLRHKYFQVMRFIKLVTSLVKRLGKK